VKRLRESFSDVYMYGVRIERETTVYIYICLVEIIFKSILRWRPMFKFFYTLPPLYTSAVRIIKGTCAVYLDLGTNLAKNIYY
jgi:hypothetical protein